MGKRVTRTLFLSIADYLMEFGNTRWSCPWNSDQNCMQKLCQEMLGVGGALGVWVVSRVVWMGSRGVEVYRSGVGGVISVSVCSGSKPPKWNIMNLFTQNVKIMMAHRPKLFFGGPGGLLGGLSLFTCILVCKEPL